MVAFRLPATTERVTHNTPGSLNERIREKTVTRIRRLAAEPHRIPARLVELDREWDIERCLGAASATLTLTGLALGTFVNKRWYILSAAVQGFFLQHAVQGWCPPLPALRAWGVRTADEIAQERFALKALQGDFTEVEHGGAAAAAAALRAVGLLREARPVEA
ncbi:MAG TPA: hypothetical protein VEB22_10320 [Phycisphaerales bacterium]|nr:hypothetical protein [Phycisphaerales bacterium]